MTVVADAGHAGGADAAPTDEFFLDTPELRALIAEVRATIAAHAEVPDALAVLRPRFAALFADQSWLPESFAAPFAASGMGGGIGSWLLFRAGDRSLSLFSLVVPPGATTPVHDHLAWGFVGLYRGEQAETVYRRTDDGSDEQHATLEVEAVNALRPGDIYTLLPPDGDIHAVTTTSTVASISIHLLANDTGCVVRHAFEPEHGRVRAFRSGYANVACREEEAAAPTERARRVVALTTPHSYRGEAFAKAARRLGIELVAAVDMPQELAEAWRYPLGVPFEQVEESARALVAYAAERPVCAIFAVDDSGSLLAARAASLLGLAHNQPAAAEAARDKFLMRTLMARAGVPVPHFRLCTTADDLEALANEVVYPCVVKPTRLNGSRGVIRADDPAQFVAAARRLTRLLHRIYPGDEPKPFLVEAFIPGFEVALEGMLDGGRLQVLALFDKPDPLDGPFFEETIYVTPSRLPENVQAAIARCAQDAARALGLETGPVHAELRVNERGPWLVEVAGRSIGGMCSRTLQFGTDASLEELILRQACGLPIESLSRTGSAGGVMMIPIPGEGLLRRVTGEEAARAVPGVEDVQITARAGYLIEPLPEGDSYLGFIFARGETPEHVEVALRKAHAELAFTIEPVIALHVER